jgi:hypothetical protein
MTTQALPVIPVSDVRSRQAEVLQMLQIGPVILSQRSRGVAILASIDEWNAVIEDARRYRRLALLKQRAQEMDDDPTLAIEWEQAKDELRKRGLLDA